MLNDLKFLYFLFTKYSLKEIKILYDTVNLLPLIFLKTSNEYFFNENMDQVG